MSQTPDFPDWDRHKLLLWVKALESGTYGQGNTRLHTIDRAGQQFFCCLGVLCEVAIADGLGLEVTIEERQLERAAGYGVEKEYAYLPREVIEWLLNSPQGDAEPFNEQVHFSTSRYRNPTVGRRPGGWGDDLLRSTEANDTLRLSFPKIARLIRAHYKLDELEAQEADTVGPA